MKKYLIIILAAATALTGCKKFLDIKPESEITGANFYQVASDAESGLIGCYDALQPDAYYGFDIETYGDVTSDNAYAGGDNPANIQMDEFKTDPNNANISRDWNQMYQAVARCNDVIDNVSTMDNKVFQGNRKKEIIAEAKFLRALDYFNLVRIWGRVPLIVNQIKDTKPESINKGNSEISDIYAQITKDLTDAVTDLPKDNETGRATKGAAEGILAKVNLTNKNWQQAADLCGQVMGLNKYSLVGNYDALWSGKNTSESLFEVQFTGGNEGNVMPDLFLPFPLATYEFLKFSTPTEDMIAAYEPNDQRKAASIIFADQYYGKNFPHVYKYRNAAGFAAPTNVPVLRYADVLLMRAEALNEISYPNLEALSILNQIRTRAGLLVSKTLLDYPTQESLRVAIAKERRVELAFEGHRWFDLLRTGKAISTLQGKYPINNDRLLFPIPQNQIDKNPNLKQNPGYN
ncbi:RagB/SusD family nutrient uptake outer membrane protein [Pedobacter sp. SD-b]|uniref:RagB/SusD family nutrient uptake outer membrane protein n=1 Tax=Pedobacter segetis TaxID=2793069 RepID=A0ABS1BHD5_9SPHI|nr:RagB/SusD family nutrient uptake outer membrane protein [Pedobacter segetis]MBK0382260.1 RagB/SusD family nutrient uptake outer membrane protein [Pedobacter segetis]